LPRTPDPICKKGAQKDWNKIPTPNPFEFFENVPSFSHFMPNPKWASKTTTQGNPVKKDEPIPTQPAGNLGTSQPKALTSRKDNCGNDDGFGVFAFISVRRWHVIILAIGAFISGLSVGWYLAAAAFRYSGWK
jgi:hypothetical protein